MIIEKRNRCVKFVLPDQKVVDILPPVFAEMKKWLQKEDNSPESGGFIVGYENRTTGNIVLEKISHPYYLDKKTRFYFGIRDIRHKIFLHRMSKSGSYYIGTWHSHPQIIPIPSALDLNDWHSTLKEDRSGSRYFFFIIAGTKEFRIWTGESGENNITEIFESRKSEDGLYEK